MFHYHKTGQNEERAAVEKLFTRLPAETGRRCLALAEKAQRDGLFAAKDGKLDQ